MAAGVAALLLAGAAQAQVAGTDAAASPQQPPPRPAHEAASTPPTPEVADADTNVDTLATVTVSGRREAIDEAPPPIAGGQVGSGARMGILGNVSVMETPFSVTSYTAETIENAQAQSVGDVAAADPSVRMGSTRSGIAEAITIRGFEVPSADLAFNGQYGLTPYWRVPVETVERVEVIKGPSAALFGMSPGGSVGGVLNLVPKRAESEPLTRITGSYSARSRFGVHADIGRRFGPDGAFGVRANLLQRGGDTEIKGQNERTSLFSLGLDYRQRRLRASLDLLWHREHINNVVRQYGLAPTLTAVPRVPENSYAYPGMGWNDSQTGSGLLKAEYDITDQVTVYASHGQGKTRWEALAANPTIMNAAGDWVAGGGWQRRPSAVKTTEAGLRGEFKTGAVGHKLAFSVNRLEQDQTFGYNRDFAPIAGNMYARPDVATPSSAGIAYPLKPALDARLTSVALADTMSFMDDRLLLTLGVRRQKVDSQSYNTATGAPTQRYEQAATTPFAGVVFKLQPEVSLYASYVEGLSQGASGPTDASVDNPGVVLPPFKSKQKEIGVKFKLGKMLATTSLFELSRPSAGVVNRHFGLFGEQRHRGLEATVAGEVTRGVRLLGGVAYTNAVLSKAVSPALQGKKGVGVAKWQFNLGAEWDTPMVPGLTLSGRALYTGKMPINAANTLSIPAWHRFDAGLRYATRLGGQNVKFGLNIENLFDKNYWGSSTSGFLHVGSPRTVSLSVGIEL